VRDRSLTGVKWASNGGGGKTGKREEGNDVVRQQDDFETQTTRVSDTDIWNYV